MNQATDLGIPPALMERYLASLPDKRSQLSTAWETFLQDPGDARLRQLREVLHRLAGSSVMYGFEGLGAQLRSAMDLAESLLEEAGADQRLRLEQVMGRLLVHWSADGRVDFG